MVIGILGAGTMGKAIIEGLLSKSENTKKIVCYDISKEACNNLPGEVCVIPPEKWFKNDNNIDAVIFAVKPNNIEKAADTLFSFLKKSKKPSPLWISIAAGITIDTLEKALSSDERICRVMPNLPLKIGAGISSYCVNSKCNDNDLQRIENIFSSCGSVIKVEEKQMDAITALCGSGPAYVFLFIEAMVEAGITAGLPLKIAKKSAIETVLGAAKMASLTDESLSSLKHGVMSPAGTTAVALKKLEENRFKYALIEAILAAKERSIQISQENSLLKNR